MTEPTPKTCRTCRHWIRDREHSGECVVVDQQEGCRNPDEKRDDTRLSIEYRILDDSGLNIMLRTGPDFGCVRHEPR